MVMVDKVGRHPMEAANKSKTEGIIEMPTTIPDPPETRGVKAAPDTGKERLTQNAGTVARRTTGRVSVGRSSPIRKKSGSH